MATQFDCERTFGAWALLDEWLVGVLVPQDLPAHQAEAVREAARMALAVMAQHLTSQGVTISLSTASAGSAIPTGV